MLKVLLFPMFQPSAPPPRSSESAAVSDSSGISTLSSVSRMTEEEAIAQGYTVIKTAQDLDNIRNDLDGKYILMNDIDLSSYSNWDPIGEVDLNTGVGIGFTGILDGNGHVIKNLTINRTSEDVAGLFLLVGDTLGTTTIGEVKNLGLENVDITGINAVGAIAGVNCGKISNCYVTGKITGGGYGTGGITGMSNNGLITKCSNYAHIQGGYAYTGGIVGNNISTNISNCNSTGDINGSYYLGGIAGYTQSGTISHCYTTGYIISIDAGLHNGGLIGVQDGGNIINSIWNTQTTGQNIYAGEYRGGTESNNKGLTTSEMQDPANWAGWDTDIWDFSTYPPTLKNMPQAGQNPDQPGGGSDPDAPDTPDTPDDPSAVGAIRLQVGANASADANAIIFNTSFDLGDIDVDFSSSQTASNSLNGIDALLDRISKKRSEFGAIMNRLESVLNTQTSQIENLTASKSTIMDADIAQESADYVKNQILQQTTASLLAQAQSANNAVIMALIRG